MVARNAERNSSRSLSPVTSEALMASRVSASETRTPFCRSRLANSTSLSSIVTPRPTRNAVRAGGTAVAASAGAQILRGRADPAKGHRFKRSLIQKIFVARRFARYGRRGFAAAALGARPPHIFLELVLRLAYVAFVFDDRVEGLVHQGAVEILDVEEGERL